MEKGKGSIKKHVVRPPGHPQSKDLKRKLQGRGGDRASHGCPRVSALGG